MTVFVGNNKEVRDFLTNNQLGSYVYMLYRPNKIPFYVGKGGGGPTARLRLLEHEKEAMRGHNIGETNPYKCNTIRKILRSGNEIIYKIESVFGDDEKAAYVREAELIARLRTH